jgi:hypothetical protein
VKPSLYAQYYFELRSLFKEINGIESSEWISKPLSIIKARRLEDRSENVWEKAKEKPVVSKSNPGSVRIGPDKSKSDNHLPFFQREGLPPVDIGRKGWQTSSPSQAQAHNRLQMMDMHKESKGKNFNPYIFKEKGLGLNSQSTTVLKRPDQLNDAISMSIEVYSYVCYYGFMQ